MGIYEPASLLLDDESEINQQLYRNQGYMAALGEISTALDNAAVAAGGVRKTRSP